jgi:hypothetical protein
MVKTGAATARVRSEIYRERRLGEEPGVSSWAPATERTQDDVGRRVTDERFERGKREP